MIRITATMANKSTKNFVMLLAILLILLVVFGCSGSKKKKEGKEREDRAKNEALRRNATIVTEEAKKYNLPICTGSASLCADDGKDCKPFALATNPESCERAPRLICVCPEKTACVMDKKQGPLASREHKGKANCLTSEQIT